MIEIVILRVLLHYPFWIQLLWALLGRRFQFLSYFYISTTGRMSLLVDTRAVQICHEICKCQLCMFKELKCTFGGWQVDQHLC